MSLCPADMSGIHEPYSDGRCLNCGANLDPEGCYICQPDNPNAAEEGCGKCEQDYWSRVLSAPAIFAAARMVEGGADVGITDDANVNESNGGHCSDCGWPIPTGECGRCLNESLERSGGGTSQTRFILASMNSVPPLSDAEQDALIEWLNSTARVRKAMSVGVLADLYGVVAAIAHLRCECKTTLDADSL